MGSPHLQVIAQVRGAINRYGSSQESSNTSIGDEGAHILTEGKGLKRLGIGIFVDNQAQANMTRRGLHTLCGL